ncbi:MAG: type II secretion system protein M [Candidatus Hydrogenedentes bacterium]|nr:type II secretion system protein M [Candidatus Hydrogenedentota bacterium]
MPKMRLQPRERMVVIAGAAALVLIVIYWVMQGPYEAYKVSAQQVQMAQTRLKQVQLWEAEVNAARERENELAKKLSGGFDLWTHVDRAVKEAKLEDRAEVKSHRAGSSSASNMTAVELDLSGVSTKELVELLHRLYDNKSVIVLQRLDQLKESAKGQGLDCRMFLAAPRT